MLSVYLDTNVWSFLDGQEQSDCEDIRPSCEMLAGLRQTRKIRIVSSPAVLEEIINASYKRMERSQRLYKVWCELVGTNVLRKHPDLIASEVLAALKHQRFSPRAPKGTVRMLQKFRPDGQGFREISDQSYKQSQGTVGLLSEIDDDLKARMRKGAYVPKDPRVEIPRNTYALLRAMIPDILRRRNKRIRAAQMNRILTCLPAAYAFIAFLVASTAYRTSRAKCPRPGDFKDARHFSYGVYVDRLVTADTHFIQTSDLVPNSGVTMMSLKDFCHSVRRLATSA